MRYFLPFITIVIIAISHEGYSQIPAEKVDGMYINWSDAEISLVSGETIKCLIRFDQLNQNMDVQYGDHLLEIPREDIRSFNFYDSIKQERRFFEKITIPSGKLIMMEYLFQNAKTAILEERFIRSFHMAYPSATLERREFFYTAPVDKKFLLHKKSSNALVLTKQNLLILLQDKKREVDAYINQNKVSFEDLDGFMAVLKFYDAL